MIYDFQQCGILTSVDSDEPVQPSYKLRNSKCDVRSVANQGWSTHTRTCTRTYSSTFFQYLAVLCT